MRLSRRLSADLAVLQDTGPAQALREGVASARRVPGRARVPVGDDRGAGAIAIADETSHQITASLTGAGPRDGTARLGRCAATQPGGAGEVDLAGGARRSGWFARRPHAGGRGGAETVRRARLARLGQGGAGRRVVAVESGPALQGLPVALRPSVAEHHLYARRRRHRTIARGPGRAHGGARLAELGDRQAGGARIGGACLARRQTLETAAALALEILVARSSGRQGSGDVAGRGDGGSRAARTLDRAGTGFQRAIGEPAAWKCHAALADLLEAPALTGDLAGGQGGPVGARAVVERVVVVVARGRRRCRWTAATRLARGHRERAQRCNDECSSKHAGTSMLARSAIGARNQLGLGPVISAEPAPRRPSPGPPRCARAPRPG